MSLFEECCCTVHAHTDSQKLELQEIATDLIYNHHLTAETTARECIRIYRQRHAGKTNY